MPVKDTGNSGPTPDATPYCLAAAAGSLAMAAASTGAGTARPWIAFCTAGNVVWP